MFNELIFAISASGVAMAILGFLARTIVTHFLSKDIEAYKTKLEAESEVEIEKLRNSLRQIAYEHEVVFSHLHKQRMDAILELYYELVEIKNAVEKVVTPHQGTEFHKVRHENAQIAATKAVEFYKMFEKKKLFLDEKLATEMDVFVTELYQFNWVFTVEMDMATSPDPNSRYGTESDVWMNNWKTFEKKFKPVLNSLESQFRLLLGVKAEKDSNRL
jgi:hypothetical protein